MTPAEGARPVFIVGAGNQGRLLLDCMKGDPRWRCVGFLDDGKAGGRLDGSPIHGVGEADVAPRSAAMVAAGFPDLRRTLVERCAPLQLDWCSYIDPRAMVGDGVNLGRGAVVLPFAMIASGVTLGEFGYVSSYASLGAGAQVGAYTSIMSGATVGAVRIGSDCVLGLKCACIDGAHLEDHVAVAPLTLFRGSAPAGTIVAGAPARVSTRRPV